MCAAPSCDDGNACTDDACDPVSGCVHRDNTAPCDDGDVCTTGDACGGGVCVGGAPTAAPSPVHQWTFNDGTASDSLGGAHGALLGGATISRGRLIVDNTLSSPSQSSAGQRMGAPLPDTVAAKTLVSWVSLATLTQHGGSALSVESTTTNPFAQRFDAIDFAERTPFQWRSGSDSFLRSPVSNGGAPETSIGEVMVAIVDDTDHSITLYRDGQPYAASYVQGALQTYVGGASDDLIGLRHSGCSNNCWLSGSVDEARVYNVPRSLCQIRALRPVPRSTACRGTSARPCALFDGSRGEPRGRRRHARCHRPQHVPSRPPRLRVGALRGLHCGGCRAHRWGASCASSSEKHPVSDRSDPSVTTELPPSAEDWARAESIALDDLKNERNVTEQISVRRYDGAPYLFAVWWNGGDQRVLVYGDKVHPERGVAALPPWFAFLGAARLRALSPDVLDGVLESLDARGPTDPTAGARLMSGESLRELFPAIVEKHGAIEYVVHHLQTAPRAVPVPGEPPPPGGAAPPPEGGVRPGSTITVQRWSLQLWPAASGLDWKLEERFERPRPPISVR